MHATIIMALVWYTQCENGTTEDPWIKPDFYGRKWALWTTQLNKNGIIILLMSLSVNQSGIIIQLRSPTKQKW